MKLVKNLALAGLLVFTVSLNTLAGEQEIPAYVPPPPKATAEAGISPSADPYIQRSGEITAETTDYLFFEALAALLSVY